MGDGGGCPLLFEGGGGGEGGWMGVLGKVLLRLVPRYSQQIYVFEKDPFVESLEGLMVGIKSQILSCIFSCTLSRLIYPCKSFKTQLHSHFRWQIRESLYNVVFNHIMVIQMQICVD